MSRSDSDTRMSSPAHDAVLIAVATCRRNDDLAHLLPHLAREAASIEPPAEILVVDNAPAPEARDLVASAQARYVHEPEPGIAAARNRALDVAGQARYLIFIDDDEYPLPGWLRALLDTMCATTTAAVAGPVISEFDGEPDPWIRASGLFERRRWPTGTLVPLAATNNLALDLDQVGSLRFDHRLGLVGGSDSLFTRQLVRQGGKIAWCDEAVVIDRVPSDRATRAWVRRRSYRIGNSEITVQLMDARSRGERVVIRLRALRRGFLRLAAGLALCGYGYTLRRLRPVAQGSRLINRGRGQLAAAAGRVYAEYGRPVTEP